MRHCRAIMLVGALLFFSFQGQAQMEQEHKILYHVLLFQWSEDSPPGIKEEIIALFEALPAKIDGFEHIEIVDLILSTDEFDTIIIQTYRSQDALNLYQDHPDHLRIVEIAPQAISKMGKFDYWK